MLKHKAKFKYSMRFLKQHENSLRSESLARKMMNHRPDTFWKEIKMLNNTKTSLPSSIDGVSGSEDIAEMWKKHFENLFNCLRDNVNDVN